MAIRAGQVLTVGNSFVIDRIQSGGVSNLNVPVETIKELGNFRNVSQVRDIPELSFDVESLDVSTEFEAILTAQTPSTDGEEFDLADAKPLDIISPFKSAANVYTTSAGIVVPYLTLESATYRFGNRQNSTQSFTMRGDSMYYVPGTPYYETFTKAGTGPYSFTHQALPFLEQGDTIYALSVCYLRTDGTFGRLFIGDDFTNTTTGFTLTAAGAAKIADGTTLKVTYGSATSATYAQTVHEGVTIKPAAVRGKDIDVYIASPTATTTFSRWTSVTAFEVNWRVTLDADEEFGNPHYVAQDYDIPEVTGSVTFRPRDVADLIDKIQEISDVGSGEVAGASTSVALPIELRINDPDDGDRVKTLYIPDARFTLPAFQGRVEQKQEISMNFASDEGVLLVYHGER